MACEPNLELHLLFVGGARKETRNFENRQKNRIVRGILRIFPLVPPSALFAKGGFTIFDRSVDTSLGGAIIFVVVVHC
jgi:hypothetical protein